MGNSFPQYLLSFADLYSHFEGNFSELSPQERGRRFAEVVKGLVPYTNLGNRGFMTPELQQESHDEGIDMIATHNSTRDVLCVQSKYSLRDKSALDSVISKFQGYHKKHYAETSGPLFAYGGLTVDGEPTVSFQLIAGNNLDSIVEKYESSHFSSLQFYHKLKEMKRLEIVDGPKILELLRTAYRKANVLPSDFELTFETNFLVKDNVYIGILSGHELRRLYANYGDALFFENIRNFLTSRNRQPSESGTTINEEIIKTARRNPDQFLARNNGIVIKASNVEPIGTNKLKLRESSVVNGCQTTMCIVGYTDESNEVYVTAKVVGTDHAWDVARAANLQNDVSRFELEIAQFLRPQVVNKAASHEGYRVIGNDSAFSLLDSIYRYEIMYADLRSLFVGIFSSSPSNIFGTSYMELLPELIEMFYQDDREGTKLLGKLFQIQQAATLAMTKLQERMKARDINIPLYQRFFRQHSAAYRAFFTLLASCVLSDIDISKKPADLKERFDEVNELLNKTLGIIHNDPEKFERYCHFAIQATISVIPSEKDPGSARWLLWQVVRRANFEQLIDRMQFIALNADL